MIQLLVLTRQMGQTYSGSTSASAMWDDPMEMLRRSRTSLMPAVLAAKAFLTSSDAPSGHLGSANLNSPAKHSPLGQVCDVNRYSRGSHWQHWLRHQHQMLYLELLPCIWALPVSRLLHSIPFVSGVSCRLGDRAHEDSFPSAIKGCSNGDVA